MSQADELLNSLAADGISTFTADPSTEPHIIIDSDRFITVPDQLKRIAVQYDHNIETVTFDCPRYWDGRDMSTMKAYINFRRPDKEIGSYIVDNIVIDESDNTVMHFDWTISGYVSEVSGPLSFLVCIKMVDSDGNETVHWNSELNQELYISTGLEVESYLEEQYPDIITQLLLRMDTAEEAAGSIAENTALAAGYAESARTDKDAAEAAMNAAISSVSEAKTYSEAAATSADNAKTSETNAFVSSKNAGSSESNARQSAVQAAAKAVNAGESASASAASARAAKTSETNAAASASTATEKASAASTSEANAKTSETNAGNSASIASTKADEASASASAASESATTATTKASETSDSASAAHESELNAASSASIASQKATAASDSERNAASYSAVATEKAASASVSETNAKTSETNAKTSETNAAASATAAATSETSAIASAAQASESASTAITKASEASVSATNAASSEHNAENSATLSQSWAVGGTGTRTGEETNNATYWSDQAKLIVGGDFATNTEAKGYANAAEANAKKYADSLAAKNIDCGTW